MFIIVESNTNYCICEDNNLLTLKFILSSQPNLYQGKIVNSEEHTFELITDSNKILETGNYEVLWKNSENYVENTLIRLVS